jgi:hypothetical protein
MARGIPYTVLDWVPRGLLQGGIVDRAIPIGSCRDIGWQANSHQGRLLRGVGALRLL